MPRFVKNERELEVSVRQFMRSPEYWRDAIGNNPKYFVHVNNGGNSLWGLSKFCAFHDITLLDYVTAYRNTTGGGDTQKHIKRICNKEWVPLGEVPQKTRKKFSLWFNQVADSRLKTNNIHLLTIDAQSNENEQQQAVSRVKRSISPDELQRRLATQAEIGQIGEEIALKYENDRLHKLGATEPYDIEHVSLKNAAAGFDIRSSYKKSKRYIEVKASVSRDGAIFISQNEILTLQKHGDEGFIYFVYVEDKAAKTGCVVKELKNPFAKGNGTEWLNPVLFQGKLPKDKG